MPCSCLRGFCFAFGVRFRSLAAGVCGEAGSAPAAGPHPQLAPGSRTPWLSLSDSSPGWFLLHPSSAERDFLLPVFQEKLPKSELNLLQHESTTSWFSTLYSYPILAGRGADGTRSAQGLASSAFAKCLKGLEK